VPFYLLFFFFIIIGIYLILLFLLLFFSVIFFCILCAVSLHILYIGRASNDLYILFGKRDASAIYTFIFILTACMLGLLKRFSCFLFIL